MQGVNRKNPRQQPLSFPELVSVPPGKRPFSTGRGKTVICEVRSAEQQAKRVSNLHVTPGLLKKLDDQFATYVKGISTHEKGRPTAISANHPLADKAGNTALHIAARDPKNAHLVEVIIKCQGKWHGLNINGVNENHQTAYDVAISTGNEKAAELLRDAGGCSAKLIPKGERVYHRREYQRLIAKLHLEGKIVHRGDLLASLGRSPTSAEHSPRSTAAHRSRLAPSSTTAPSNPTLNPTRRHP
ncbi:MAG: hypothetical protein JWP52_2475 [Rhizobacter sp.]|nr:hypothetical protein [Rhizobacter sp.]